MVATGAITFDYSISWIPWTLLTASENRFLFLKELAASSWETCANYYAAAWICSALILFCIMNSLGTRIGLLWPPFPSLCYLRINWLLLDGTVGFIFCPAISILLLGKWAISELSFFGPFYWGFAVMATCAFACSCMCSNSFMILVILFVRRCYSVCSIV